MPQVTTAQMRSKIQAAENAVEASWGKVATSLYPLRDYGVIDDAAIDQAKANWMGWLNSVKQIKQVSEANAVPSRGPRKAAEGEPEVAV